MDFDLEKLDDDIKQEKKEVRTYNFFDNWKTTNKHESFLLFTDCLKTKPVDDGFDIFSDVDNSDEERKEKKRKKDRRRSRSRDRKDRKRSRSRERRRSKDRVKG